MAKRLIGYIVVLATVIYLFFMYDDRVVSGLLIFVAAYPFVSFAFLLAVRNKISVILDRVPAMGEAGKPVRAGISVRNISSVFGLECGIIVRIGNSYERKWKKEYYRVRVGAGESETIWCIFQTEMCGVVNVRTGRIRIYDPLGIFYITKKCDGHAEVKIMPEFEIMPVELTRRIREFQADSELYSTEKKGDDPSETYQIRPYRAMDSLRDIHWKLSAKEDEFMVKERGFPLGCVILVWFDVREGKCTAQGFSGMVSKAAAVSAALTEEKCIHMAAWYEEKNERIVKIRVDSEESMYQMIWRLLDLEPCRDIQKRDICYEETFRGTAFGSTVIICGNGTIYADGQETGELLRL